MASHVSNDIPSLTRSVFVDEEGVYRISINTIKEMKQRDGNLVFLKEKLSLFIQRLVFNISHFLQGFVQPSSEASYHVSQLCVCASR